MARLPQRPVLYEINTWVWLAELGRREGRPITLATVPTTVWDNLASLGIDAVWLMGVWARSPVATEIARQDESLLEEYRRVLPDFTPADVIGSPYAVHRYVVEPRFGGSEALAAARKALADRGIRLILDFVPNHVAPDHPWVSEHPEYFVTGGAIDIAQAPADYVRVGSGVFAHGRDPYFLPWTDTVQLNAFSLQYRQAAARTLCDIAGQCDGVRCDMAMLLVSRIFRQTWQDRAGTCPPVEFWQDVIGSVRARAPDLVFLAEAYWDMELELLQQGFDYCYDKRFYDRLLHETAESVRLHILAQTGYQENLVRFTENHDEARAATVFAGRWLRAASVAAATLPGARLYHEGQLEGRRIKLPVQLGRRPAEEITADLRTFYLKLLSETGHSAFRQGGWLMCERTGWPDNPSFLNIAAWCWRKADQRRIIIVNLSSMSAQARIIVPWADLVGHAYKLVDPFSDDVYPRSGDEMAGPGLYVDLKAWGFHFLGVERERA